MLDAWILQVLVVSREPAFSPQVNVPLCSILVKVLLGVVLGWTIHRVSQAHKQLLKDFGLEPAGLPGRASQSNDLLRLRRRVSNDCLRRARNTGCFSFACWNRSLSNWWASHLIT